MNVDYATLAADLEDGSFRARLEQELIAGFREIHHSGERLPTASHYASQIATIVNAGADLDEETKFELYQEILEAVEKARAAVLAEQPS